jgi:hypothetical protein
MKMVNIEIQLERRKNRRVVKLPRSLRKTPARGNITFTLDGSSLVKQGLTPLVNATLLQVGRTKLR